MKKPKDLLTIIHPKTAPFHNRKVPPALITTQGPLDEPAEEIPTEIGAKIGFLVHLVPLQDHVLRLNALKVVPEKEEVTINVNKLVEEVNVQVALWKSVLKQGKTKMSLYMFMDF